MIQRIALVLFVGILGLGTFASSDVSATDVAEVTDVPVLAAPYHQLDQSYLYLRVYEDSLIIRLEITTGDLERALGFGWDAEAGVSIEQVRAQLGAIREYAEERFSAGTADGVVNTVFRDVDILDVGFADFVRLEYTLPELTVIPDVMDFYFAVIFDVDSLHRNFLIIEHNWKTATFNNESGISLVFSPGAPRQSLDLTDGSLFQGFMGLIWLGVLHIWIGIDHILFLIALMLPSVLLRRDGEWAPAEGFRPAFVNIVAIVTCFTLAHSITLALAGLGVVDLPSAFVESIIAASIAAAAAANLMPKLQVKEWLVAFGFGLFHGFGFASVMGDIGVGNDRLVASVLGFNIGVELGQLAIIVAIFPVLYFLRDKRVYKPLMYVGSIGMIVIATIWFGERALGWDVHITQIVMNIFSFLPGVG
ncbi:MAG: HupE/UreJ family protein [Gemmatimonadota bacterium]